MDSCFVVTNASPTINVRSDSRHSETCPTLWPGVCNHLQPAMNGTEPSAGNGLSQRLTSTGPRGNNGDSKDISPPPTFGSGGGYEALPLRYGSSNSCA